MTERRERLVEIIATGQAATQREAAIMAGFSPKSADQLASMVLKEPEVAAALVKRKAKESDKGRGHTLFLERARKKVARQLAESVESGKGLASDPLAAAQTFGVITKALEADLDYRERTGQGGEDMAAHLETATLQRLRAALIGARMVQRYGAERAEAWIRARLVGR